MVRFQVGRWETAMGSCWIISPLYKEDENHSFARQKYFDGNLSFEELVGQAKKHFGLKEEEIELYG